jgi:hypothetical protein
MDMLRITKKYHVSVDFNISVCYSISASLSNTVMS